MASRQLAGRWLVLGGCAAAVAALALALALDFFPLGVPGEWEWMRISRRPALVDVLLGGLGVVLYATLAAALTPRANGLVAPALPGRLALLVPLGVAAQLAIMWAAPLGFGLTRWVTLAMSGSSGYNEVARQQVDDLPTFLKAYPDWIKHQDALHIGTHPPGLIVLTHTLRRFFLDRPAQARAVVRATPRSVQEGFRELIVPFPDNADRAAIAVLAALTLLLSAATAIPLYVLSRAYLDQQGAWMAAALWPLVPSALLFHPTADTAFPFAATLALALAAWSPRAARAASYSLAILTGIVLGVSLQFTLAFLAVGLIAGLLALSTPLQPRRDALRWLAIGAGFLAVTLLFWAVTGANPFAIWWVNQRNHARFYHEFPRSYLAWIAVNPVELIIGLGLPASFAVAMAFALKAPGRLPALWTLLVLALLTLSGRSLSEVARLWLPLMPPLLVAAGGGCRALDFKRGHLALLLLFMGAESLALEAWIQVVYPVSG